jgi:uncharacterized membrane protein (UPF0127 family)
MISFLDRKSCLVVVALAAGLLLAACGGAKKAPAARKTVDDFFPIKVGDRVVQMQIAILPAEQARGLMYRKTLGADEGMLFAYRQPQTMSFYMRNTSLPLDIGFFSPDGELKEIYPMYPFDERTVTSRSSDLRYALEMNQGWFKANGVKPGARIETKALAAALLARGLQLQFTPLPE